jgi:glycosyltransferase involved in cell wall biosynthesis
MNVVVAALSAPAHLNGVSRHAIGLVHALLSTRAVTNVHFLAGEWQKQMFQPELEGADARFHAHWIPLRDANFSRLFWYFHELPLIAAQLEADIVHLTYPSPIATHAFQCPVVLSLHDLYPFDIPENFGFFKSALARQIIRQCIRSVDAIACVSASTQAQLEQWFPAAVGKATIVPNVVDLNPAKGIACRIGTLKAQSFILCVAQHRPNKNVPLAIRIFDRLIRDETLPSNTRLFVVGIPGPDTKKIQSQILDLGLTDRVHLSSGLPDAELKWCYRNCAVLLAPSKTEGFGLPVAEGMIAGCRIVCSEIPAFREIGENHCRFVAWGGDLVGSYARAIRESLALPQPRVHELLPLSSVSVGRQYLDLYESLRCAPISEFDKLRQHERVLKGANPLGSRST